MGIKQYKPEEIVTKLRQVRVLVGHPYFCIMGKQLKVKTMAAAKVFFVLDWYGTKKPTQNIPEKQGFHVPYRSRGEPVTGEEPCRSNYNCAQVLLPQ